MVTESRAFARKNSLDFAWRFEPTKPDKHHLKVCSKKVIDTQSKYLLQLYTKFSKEISKKKLAETFTVLPAQDILRSFKDTKCGFFASFHLLENKLFSINTPQ